MTALLPIRSTTLFSSWWTFEGLHYEHHLASTMVHDIEELTMSTSAHGATGALSMGLSAEYISNLTISIFSKVFVLLT